jgi:hypothetical protein
MYSEAQITEKRNLARRLGLSGHWLLRNVERAQKACNGIGAAWFPAWLRWIINICFPEMVIIADIHDVRYYIGGDLYARRLADTEFLANGYIIAEENYGKIPPVRYIAELVVRLMYRALRLSGRLAWEY